METAMTAHEASSSSSSNPKLWNFDVFLSFRGEDTRHGFTGHLHAALEDKGYKAYIDEDDLEKTEDLKKLLTAIEESKISIIVFSKMYAYSSWCLDELVKIMKCKDKLQQRVLPIFYHVDPSNVRWQDGDLTEPFQKHEDDIREEKDDEKREAKRERVKEWRKALEDAANVSGHPLRLTDNRREATLIREIVDKNIMKWLPITNELNVAKHPVGINSRVQDIITRLSCGESEKVRMVGIWGMSGLGKTTIANAIYNQIHRGFQFKSFLANVRDTTSRPNGLVVLQKKLMDDILKKTPEIGEIGSVDDGISKIQQQCQHRKVLIIMDDIDKEVQLDKIAGDHTWFGAGSRIIITTQNKHLIRKVDVTYSAQELNDEEALKLFSWHAFGKSSPDENDLQLSKQVVSYCKGLPLTLEILGCFLNTRPKAEWESHLEKLKKIPDRDTIKRLRISFDGLDDSQKAIFLDISCFFIGWSKEYVAKVLDGTIDISVLYERCLITIEPNVLNMHDVRNVLNMNDLTRQMAREIISEKFPGHPGKWSRLWNLREVTNVSTNKSETEGLLQRKHKGEAEEFVGVMVDLESSNNASLSTRAFAKMKKLKFLELYLYHVYLEGEYKHLSKELMWLRWYRCHLKFIPDDFFSQDNLVFIDMQWSNLVQVWEGSKSLERLKIMNLSHSKSLKKSPDFSQVPDLKELILENCDRLSEIHPFIGQLENLSFVNLRNCHGLISLPREFYMSKSVKTLCLNNCRKFRELHEDIGEMESLQILEAEDTVIREVPPSIGQLENLSFVSLRNCHGLISLPREFYRLRSVKTLCLNNCRQFRELHEDIGEMKSLEILEAEDTAIRHVPPSIEGLKNLTRLSIRFGY